MSRTLSANLFAKLQWNKVLSSQVVYTRQTTMIGQKKISTFFTPMSQKRENVPEEKKIEPEPKKRKTEHHHGKGDTENIEPKDQTAKPKGFEPPPATPSTSKDYMEPPASVTEELSSPDNEDKSEQEISSSPPASTTKNESQPLSPEQKQKMKENKTKAELKLLEKKTHGLATNLGQSWYTALQAEFSKPYFISLAQFVNQERARQTIYPPAEEVFSFTNACEIKQVRVVILGQDPYHGPRQAHGICFSVQKGVKPPPSLVNMYKELGTDIEGFQAPDHGYLMGWAEQGVLMLNAVLTVRSGQANSHKDKGWEKFTDAVISWINKNMTGVVFMLWGSYAQKKGACIDKKKHHVLKGVHPSPLSAHRGYFGCKHFSKCNEFLTSQGRKPIDWNHLP